MHARQNPGYAYVCVAASTSDDTRPYAYRPTHANMHDKKPIQKRAMPDSA